MKKDEIIKGLRKIKENYHAISIGLAINQIEEDIIEEAIKIIEESKKSVNGCLFLSVVEALMDMVNQHCSFDSGLFDDGLSANELAFETLEGLGFLKKKKGKYYLDWKYKYFKE